MKPDLKQAPKFTGEDLAEVFSKRWMIRDMANSFIRHLKPVSYPDVTHPVFRKTVAFAVQNLASEEPPQ